MKRLKFNWHRGVVIFSLVLLIGYIWYVRSKNDNWMPSTPESPGKTIFDAKWGDGESELGFYKASGKEGDIFSDGFAYFSVNADIVYVADPVKKQISVFDRNKLTRRYQYSIGLVQGLAVMGDFLYVLDGTGRMAKINTQTGEYKVSKLVVIENEYGYIAQNGYAIYILDDKVVLNDRIKNTCVSIENLSKVDCPFKQIDYLAKYLDVVYLPSGNYAILIDYDIWLYNKEGKKIGVVKKLPWESLLYSVRGRVQVTLDGVYYVEHSNHGAKIKFKSWQR